MTHLQEILVSDELLRPDAKHGHRNPGDAFAPPAVFLKTIKRDGTNRETKTHNLRGRNSQCSSKSSAPTAQQRSQLVRYVMRLACERRRRDTRAKSKGFAHSSKVSLEINRAKHTTGSAQRLMGAQETWRAVVETGRLPHLLRMPWRSPQQQLPLCTSYTAVRKV